MSTITIPYTPATGDILESQDFADNIAYANGTALAFDTANGYLDEDNLAPALRIPKETIQPKVWHDGKIMAATTRRDYSHKDLFQGVDLTSATSATNGYEAAMVGIAGAGASWYNRKTLEYIVFEWDLFCVGDTDLETDELGVPVPVGTWGEGTQDVGYRLALFINGRRIRETDFRFIKPVTTMVESTANAVYNRDSRYQASRAYSCTLLLDSGSLNNLSGQPLASASPLIKGYHSAGIYVVSDGGETAGLSDTGYANRERFWGMVRVHTSRFQVRQRYGA
jgi:hypothetical protein